MSSDEELMLAFQQGSTDAFQELFGRYRDKVYGFFRRRLNDRGCAEDLAQETFLAIVRGVQRYEPRARFRTYLYGIAANLLHTQRRKDGRQVPDGEDQPASPGTIEAVWVRRALEQLEANDREMLLMREYEQLSYAEIAELLNIPINTVRSRLFRARMAMKELLVGQQQTAGRRV